MSTRPDMENGMLKSPVCAAFVTLVAFAGPLKAQDQAELARKGAPAYRICAGCHSLQPGVHLSGPSLAGLWGKKAGTIPGFGRHTEALKKSGIIWDEDTLNAWLANPQAMVPGTTMMFRGVEKDETRVNLIAFLRRAMGQDGAAKVVKDGLIAKDMAEGQIPASLKDAGPEKQITAIRHCGDAYFVTTAAGAQYPLWETNVRIKIDTSERGPGQGKPILLRSGMAGDRVSVVFPSLTSLRTLLTEKC
jgi:cytochrome c